jgi:hypothetical protein
MVAFSSADHVDLMRSQLDGLIPSCPVGGSDGRNIYSPCAEQQQKRARVRKWLKKPLSKADFISNRSIGLIVGIENYARNPLRSTKADIALIRRILTGAAQVPSHVTFMGGID